MYAIVEASGRQYQLEAGRFVDIDLVPEAVGQPFVFEQILMIVNGKESHLGQPYVDGAKVTGHVLSHGQDRKIIVYLNCSRGTGLFAFSAGNTAYGTDLHHLLA